MANTGPKEVVNVGIRYLNADSEWGACLTAKRDIPKGEEIMVDYGAEVHSAMLMFAIYGFALAPEVHDPLQHQVPNKKVVDGCAGIRPHEFPEPDPKQEPSLHNY